MLRLLDQRADGHRLFEVGSFTDLDLETLVPMLDRAWRLDYAGEPRLDFDRAVLRRMMCDPWWVAVLAVAPDGTPSGFELALARTLYAGGRALRAFYASVFTVSADHRRAGLGRSILESINRLVFEERGADVIVSTFHQGHAGSPVVQSTFDRIADWGVARFHSTPIWSRRLDREPLPPLDPPPTLVEGGHALDLGAIDALLRSSFGAAFALSESLAAQYLAPATDPPTSGVLSFRFEDAAGPCLCAYNILPMARDERRLRPVGQLQLLLAPGASAARTRTVVHHLATFLADRGCFAMTVLEMGTVPRAVLEELGFAPTDTTITFAARGPKRNLEAFAQVRPPFFLDFT